VAIAFALVAQRPSRRFLPGGMQVRILPGACDLERGVPWKSEGNGADNSAPAARLDEQLSSKESVGGSNPSRCVWIVRTGSSMAEPPPFKRRDAGSSPARCNPGEAGIEGRAVVVKSREDESGKHERVYFLLHSLPLEPGKSSVQ
jgi:hypothetical protein